MRILIVKLGSIGDVVHTLPALAAIREGLPHAEISWVVERSSSEILRDNPLLDHLIEVDTKALRRGRCLGSAAGTAPADTSVTRLGLRCSNRFSRTLKSASIARLSGARRIWVHVRACKNRRVGFYSQEGSCPKTHPRHLQRFNLLTAPGFADSRVQRTRLSHSTPNAARAADRSYSGTRLLCDSESGRVALPLTPTVREIGRCALGLLWIASAGDLWSRRKGTRRKGSSGFSVWQDSPCERVS